MNFHIAGLSPEPFHHLFGLSDEALVLHGARRMTAHSKPGYPDRIELRDAEIGQSLLLVNYSHLPAEGPYQSSHAVFVREGATSRFDATNTVPELLRTRTLSLRAFDEFNMMLDADLVDGREIEPLIERFLANPGVAFIHVHFAKPGCFACRVDRI